MLMSDHAGDSFSIGDVLLEIETDKAQMDVEAQDDGKMAKITVTVPAANLYLGWYTDNHRIKARSRVKGRKGRHSDSCVS